MWLGVTPCVVWCQHPGWWARGELSDCDECAAEMISSSQLRVMFTLTTMETSVRQCDEECPLRHTAATASSTCHLYTTLLIGIILVSMSPYSYIVILALTIKSKL